MCGGKYARSRTGKRKPAAWWLPLILLLMGASLLLYPAVSNYWNSLHASIAITDYANVIAQLDDTDYAALLRDAQQYNSSILELDNPYLMTQERQAQYNSLLNLSGDGIMGYIEIPAVHVELPIYHGTDESVLQVAVGHLEWTSLPVGGSGTHCVLSGHTGLPSARLFTDIDRLQPGDTFYIHVLNQVMEYRVDQTLVVLPEQTENLEIVPGKDYCTLVTCTPYGINTHRLLVRGERADTPSAVGSCDMEGADSPT